MTLCERCYTETNVTTGSYFNRQMICLECDRKERAHPKYAEAKRIEGEAVKRGDYNFPGIGKPADL